MPSMFLERRGTAQSSSCDCSSPFASPDGSRLSVCSTSSTIELASICPSLHFDFLPYLSIATTMGCAQSKTEDVAATNPPEAEPVAVEEPKVEEPKAEETEETEETVTPAEPEAETSAEPAKELYKITGHEIDEAGVVFYVVESAEGNVAFKKRFSEFKALVVALGNPKNLPALPSSGLGAKLRGKHNPDMIQEREGQLAVVLNAIASDAELAEKESFKKFVE
ncbi:hypothetical protein L914_00665 [Phytophthora nicotianae]|uniref:PX domain-containing protein n=2 Tax=Phytophthora nicotianae TaxID=4792 RepID=V9G0S2_PHYNI|nr:hypothetical protein F443_00731 [Phytophthora nicotianae P1569]ETM56362.1 hypothetical protein L914_00665 [Phytophthora nicotianae]